MFVKLRPFLGPIVLNQQNSRTAIGVRNMLFVIPVRSIEASTKSRTTGLIFHCLILHCPVTMACCGTAISGTIMMTSSNGNIFRITGPLCGEFNGPGEFPAQRPVMRSFDVFFDLRPNKRLSKQPWGWWFETPLWSLWRQRNAILVPCHVLWCPE